MPGKHLDTIVTVIARKAVKLSVTLFELSPTSRDPLNQRPYAYAFREIGTSTEQGLGEFVVYVSDMVASFKLTDAPHRNQVAVRYGIHAKTNEPDKNEFILTREALSEFENRPKPKRKELEYQILEFFFRIYEEFPQELIGIPDLEDFFPHDNRELLERTSTLVEKGYLIKDSRSKSWSNDRAYGYSSAAYRINPVEEDQVQAYLDRRSQSSIPIPEKKLIFVSYSNKDKLLAGQIKARIESDQRLVFLAHEDIDVSEDWEYTIRLKLRECDVFLALITENFRSSDWTDQEVGQAIARGAMIISLFRPNKPHGFLGRLQGLFLCDDLEELCSEILERIESSVANQ